VPASCWSHSGFFLWLFLKASLVDLLLFVYNGATQFAPGILLGLFWKRASLVPVTAGLFFGEACALGFTMHPIPDGRAQSRVRRAGAQPRLRSSCCARDRNERRGYRTGRDAAVAYCEKYDLRAAVVRAKASAYALGS